MIGEIVKIATHQERDRERLTAQERERKREIEKE